jgi:Putative addiction module component
MTTPHLSMLETEVLALPAHERAYLIERLIASLDDDPQLQAVWVQEALQADAKLDARMEDWVEGRLPDPL